jgi:hypothetical protein
MATLDLLFIFMYLTYISGASAITIGLVGQKKGGIIPPLIHTLQNLKKNSIVVIVFLFISN